MATVTKFANANTVVTTGWTSPTNAYADDTSYATAAPGKNADITTDWGFPAFATGDIPDGVTINSVTAEVVYKSSVTNSANASLGLQLNNGGTLLGAESTLGMVTTDTVATQQATAGIALADLRTANTVTLRVRGHRAASNTAITWSVDYVKLTVDYSASTNTAQSAAVTSAVTVAGSEQVARQMAVAVSNTFLAAGTQGFGFSQAVAVASGMAVSGTRQVARLWRAAVTSPLTVAVARAGAFARSVAVTTGMAVAGVQGLAHTATAAVTSAMTVAASAVYAAGQAATSTGRTWGRMIGVKVVKATTAAVRALGVDTGGSTSDT